jgi:hypothetical protein
MTRSSRWLTLPAAALVAGALASCAHKEEAPKQPQAAAVPADPTKQTLQQTSQELTAQQAALDQAHNNVLTLEQQLTQARAREDQERAKVMALQQLASRNLDEAQLRAQQEQAASVHAQGLQTIAGEVTEATASRVVLHTQDGRTMSFGLTPRTRVMIGTEQRAVKDIQQGADAQVSFDPKADKPAAVTIRLMPAAH